jgi:transcriptional regulator with XRE-family HTH domain
MQKMPGECAYNRFVEAPGFGTRLQQAREAKGLTKLQLATAAGIRDTDINRWERLVDVDVRISTIRTLAGPLGVTADYLIGLAEFESNETAKALAELRRAGYPESELRQLVINVLENEQGKRVAAGAPSAERSGQPEGDRDAPPRPGVSRGVLGEVSGAEAPRDEDRPKRRRRGPGRA